MELQTKFTFVFFVLIVCYNSFDLVNGVPKPSTTVAEHLELVDIAYNNGETNTNLTRVARDWSGQCSARGGCFRGYCWAGCAATLLQANEWCYTTKSYSQSFEYVTCSQDSECNLCWSCAGSCTI